MSLLDYFKQPEGLRNISPEELIKLQKSDSMKLVDVRTTTEFRRSHIMGADSHPLTTMDVMASQLEKDSNVLLICATGHRSRAAAAKLLKKGFTNISHLEGGMRAWNKAGLETTKD